MDGHKIELKYGDGKIALTLDRDIHYDILEPKKVDGLPNPIEAVRESLEHPINDLTLTSFGKIKNVAIAINDKTRPVPHHFILPPLLDKLQNMGLQAQNIRFFIATGTHVPMPEQEFERVLDAEIIKKYPVVSHDCDSLGNLKYFGETSRGTPVWINKAYIESDLKIVIGNIEPHHFMGFSGAAKSLSVGLAGRNTINTNHAMLTDPQIAQMAGLQYAVNVVLNDHKEITRVFCGSPVDVMRAGIEETQRTALVQINDPYDLVIASAGGVPKDINLYQAQKAITHAAAALRDGGVVLLAAQCPEGSGSVSFENFVKDLHSIEEVFTRFKQDGFKIGPHKAFQIAKLASRVNIFMVSDIPSHLVEKWFIHPVDNLDQGFELAKEMLNPLTRIAIMPRATNTIPHISTFQ
jgi:nickel-dependent lactate racemase